MDIDGYITRQDIYNEPSGGNVDKPIVSMSLSRGLHSLPEARLVMCTGFSVWFGKRKPYRYGLEFPKHTEKHVHMTSLAKLVATYTFRSTISSFNFENLL